MAPPRRDPATDGFTPLVDERFGLIRRLHQLPAQPDLPASLCRAHAAVADSSRFSAWSCDDRAAGFAWDDPGLARAAAAGEAVERYCGNLVPQGLRRDTYGGLRAAGEAAIDPRHLALFNDEQYAEPGFPFVRFDPSLPVLWTRGRSLTSGGEIWVPASLVWVTFSTGHPTAGEPKTHATPYAGIATGRRRADAELSALFELLERDAVSLAWHAGRPLPRLSVPDWLRAKVEAPEVGLSFHLFPSDFGAPVVGALAEDRGRGLLAIGLAARANAVEAALKAAAEAHQLLLTARLLDDPESPYMRRVAAGAPGLGVKPWRADRAYFERYRRDWRDAWDLLCHLQIYLDPSPRNALAERLAAGPGLALEEVPDLAPAGTDPHREIVRRLDAAGCGPVAVDVTTPDVAAQGLEVVRVVAPGLYGNAPAAFPYLGGARFAACLNGASPERLPLPYA